MSKMFMKGANDHASFKVVNDQGHELSLAADDSCGAFDTLRRMDLKVFSSETDSGEIADTVYAPTPEEFLQELAKHLGYEVKKQEHWFVPQTSLPEPGRNPEPVEMEPFGQYFVGIAHNYPELDQDLVKQAEEDFVIEEFGNNVHVSYFLSDRLTRRVIWSMTSLPAEYAYTLYKKLRFALFGTDPNAKFTAKK